MRMIKVKKIENREIQIREVTAGEIRAWLVSLQSEKQCDPVGDLLFPQTPLRVLSFMTDLSQEAMEQFTPMQLRDVLGECQEINPDFFGLLSRLMEAGKQTR
ncbi:MAG: hypothetical protein H7832_01425 [Magnetococcus sp. DMHC-6]